ncbi:MAG: hypothetical protein RLZZ453_634 [Chlamydiota bacterium]|jgi:hypothetical protein
MGAIFNKLKKVIFKETKKKGVLSKESLKDQDELTKKELNKRFPNSLHGAKLSQKNGKKPAHKKVSKRSTPGSTITTEAPTASSHREGKRWIKTTKQQIAAERKVLAHQGARKK